MNHPFRMTVEDMFVIGGEGLALSGLVVTGTVQEGAVTVGDSVEVVSTNADKQTVVLNGVEMFGKDTDTATKGDNVGLLFSELQKKDVSKGDLVQSVG